MKLAQGAKRAAVFAFYDKDGIVDDYIPVLVGAVRRHCARLVCVVNGDLTEEGRAKLAPVCDEILMRPNEGLDVTGYKEGFFHLEGELGGFRTVRVLCPGGGTVHILPAVGESRCTEENRLFTNERILAWLPLEKAEGVW